MDFGRGCDYYYGYPILATSKGEILDIITNASDPWGLQVIIDLGDGYTAMVGHLSTIGVRKGISVEAGQEIGAIGNTGYCITMQDCRKKGTHIHFVVRKDGKAAIKPEPMSEQEGFYTGQSEVNGESIANPVNFIIIDEQNASRNGAAQWNELSPEGYMGKVLWTSGAGANNIATATMTWTPNIPETGNYAVYTHIPSDGATAEVKYGIVHAKNSSSEKIEEETIINQASYSNKWVRLSPSEGWYFAKGDGYVELDNANISADKKVGFDAVMFTAIEWGPVGGNEPEIPISILKNWSFEDSNKPVDWVLEDHHGQARMLIDETGGFDGGRCLLVEVLTGNKEEFYCVQAKQRDISLQNGDDMTISFKLQADQPGNYYVALTKDAEPWNTFGLFEWIAVKDIEWHEHKFNFTAENNPEECHELVKLSFHIGETAGIARIDDIILQKTELYRDTNQTDDGFNPPEEPEPTPPQEEPVPEPQPEPEPPLEPAPSYTYSWKTSNWSDCSETCGTGSRTRNVWCERNDSEIVDEVYCSVAKPALLEICNGASGCKNPIATINYIFPASAEYGQKISFKGTGSDPDGGSVFYKWTSSINGNLSYDSSFTNSNLSTGSHTIAFFVTDDEGKSAYLTKELVIYSAPEVSTTDDGDSSELESDPNSEENLASDSNSPVENDNPNSSKSDSDSGSDSKNRFHCFIGALFFP
ncbi:MAG: peptidoglycan DD-metalloendopeptidase family protein [bacterium]